MHEISNLYENIRKFPNYLGLYFEIAHVIQCDSYATVFTYGMFNSTWKIE